MLETEELPNRAPGDVDELRGRVISDLEDNGDVMVRSVFDIVHGTRLADAEMVYQNRYVLARIGGAFGACAHENRDGCIDAVAFSGHGALSALRSGIPALEMAVLDAVLGAARPHHRDGTARPVPVPPGTPDVRARARDRAVTDAAGVPPGACVGLIGVVSPMMRELINAGATVIPCDRNLDECLGVRVEKDAVAVVESADHVIATGMTVLDGSFDDIRSACAARGIPLTVYAQSGSAIVREFVGWGGVSALIAEPFPFSQFSCDRTWLYRYGEGARR